MEKPDNEIDNSDKSPIDDADGVVVYDLSDIPEKNTDSNSISGDIGIVDADFCVDKENAEIVINNLNNIKIDEKFELLGDRKQESYNKVKYSDKKNSHDKVNLSDKHINEKNNSALKQASDKHTSADKQTAEKYNSADKQIGGISADKQSNEKNYSVDKQVNGKHNSTDRQKSQNTKNGKQKPRKKHNWWSIKITVISLFLSAFISFLSEMTASAEHIIVTILLLLFLIFASILFDGIGVAVTSCDVSPLMSMASRNVYGAKTAMWLVKNNEKVSNVCNDVIGDIFGIISGACAAAIVVKIIVVLGDGWQRWLTIGLSSVVSALTIGGKAFLKNIAITNSKEFVMFVARIIAVFSPEERRRKKKIAKKKGEKDADAIANTKKKVERQADTAPKNLISTDKNEKQDKKHAFKDDKTNSRK